MVSKTSKLIIYKFSFMKWFPILGLFLFVMSCTRSELSLAEETPNIILIITDDQGWGDLGFHGNPWIKTPHLDALAKESVRFTQFYVSPVCAPTRASLMTGRYSLRTGVIDTYNGGAIMATEEKTIAEYLREAGYATGMFGKWHLGDVYPCRPHDQGFDTAIYHHAGGMAQPGDLNTYFRFDSAYFDPTLVHNGVPNTREGYCSDIYTDDAIDFLTQHQDTPFFAYISYNAPHTPLQLPQKYYALYQDLDFDPSDVPEFDRPHTEMTERNKEDARKVYGMVSNIDDNVGKLLQELDDLGLRENTVVIFMTDNGPQQIRYNGPFRGRKTTVYEGGIRVPFLMRWPKHFETSLVVQIPCAHIDVLPTIMHIAGIKAPVDVDGENFWPLLQGQTVDWVERPLYHYWARGYEEPWQNTAIRQGPYKLVGMTGYAASLDELELYNLDHDPGELVNLIRDQRQIATDLKTDFEEWLRDVMESPHLNQAHLHVGSSQENPVILNRNDAKGSWGVWTSNNTYVYWDVFVEEAGTYEITATFKDSIDNPASAWIRLNKVQRSVQVEEPVKEIHFDHIELDEGRTMVESMIRFHRGGQWYPFSITINRK